MKKSLSLLKGKRVLSLFLALTLSAGMLPDLTVFAQSGEQLPYVKAEKGLWITEIYQNDVNRSAVYSTSSDLMEYIEIVNTSSDKIIFNDTYTLWYEYLSGGRMVTQSKPLTIASNEEVIPVISPGETVVIRVARPDIDPSQYPSDSDFRKTLDVAPNIKIWNAAGQNGWGENCRGCSIRLKSDKDTILSRYIYNFTMSADGTVTEKTDDVTSDGLSVSLQIPDYGYEMVTLEPKSVPTPGYVYSDQYNGQKIIAPADSAPKGLIITEILPQDSSSATSTRFGSGSNQILEFIELTNTTDKDIDLNREYQLTYSSKTNNGIRNYSGGNERLVAVTQLANAYDDTCIIPAGKSAVIWIHREETNTAFLQDKYGFTMGMLTKRENAAAGVKTVYDTWPTEEEFREIRGIAADVPVFACRNINGLGNDRNSFALHKIADPDAAVSYKVTEFATELVSQYSYNTTFKGDTSGGKSVSLRVNAEGPQMGCYQPKATPTPGIVTNEQLTYLKDDGTTPVIREWSGSPIPEFINQGDILRTPFYYENVKTMELFYKTSNSDSFTKGITTSFSIYNKWYAFIPSDVLLHADYVDFYIKARGVYHTSQTKMKRVKIQKINDASGIRVSLNGMTAGEEESVSGSVNVTAKNYENSDTPVSITLDGNILSQLPSLEKGAFFTFTHDGGNGLDVYYKNALVVKENEDDDHGEIIKLFPSHSEVPKQSSMAIPVDSRYFTYNPDGSATIDLYIYTGTNGSTFESFTSENNDNFTAQWVRLSLPDGTTLEPTEYKGYQVTTGEAGEGTEKLGWQDLDPDKQVLVGDSNNQYVYLKASFTIPAEPGKLDAVASVIDTDQLSVGAHSLVVTSGDTSKTIILNVSDNTYVPKEDLLAATDLSLTVNAGENPVKVAVTAKEGDKDITLYEAQKTDIKVYEGTGDSTSSAAVKSGNGATVSNNGEFPYQLYEISVNGNETDNLRFDITAKSDYGRDVQLYALNVETDEWEVLYTTRDGDNITSIFPLENRLERGKVLVLAQARGTESAPYTTKNTDRTQVNNYSDEWTGEGEHAVPKQYDFSMAWITDTQYYSERYHDHFLNEVNWIIENKDELNIKYVAHTGDIVDEWDEEDQYIVASEQIGKFQAARLPSGVLAGNHDVAHGAEKYNLYWKYFGEDRYNSNSYYGGSYKNNLGHYDLITVDGVEMIFIYMSWDIYYPETEWINSVLAEYPDRKAVIAVHCGINATGAQSYQSRMLLNEVCSKNTNVFAIINGHYHGSALNFEGFDDNGDGVDDRVVYQICTDYQSAPEGGSGYVKMLYFDLANDKIYINSYSPSLDDYNYYDTPKLDEYPIGLNTYGIDITMLDVDFDRDRTKSLSVSGMSSSVLTDMEIGGAQANGTTEILFESVVNEERLIYAVTTDENGNITAYSQPEAYMITPAVSSITVSPSTVAVQKGNVQSFTTTVTTVNGAAQTVTWSVSGNNDNRTIISESGVLTVSADESSDILTVTATSTADSSKTGTAVITVTDPAQLTDKSQLIDQITAALAKETAAVAGEKQGDYPQNAKDTLSIAIEYAKAVADNQAATQTEVNNAVSKLYNAVLDFENAKIKVDFTQLDLKIAEANNKEKGTATEQSWKVLQTALTAAENLRANGYVSQGQVNDALNALTSSISGIWHEYHVTNGFESFTGTGNRVAEVDAVYEKFVRLMLNGSEVDAADYTITSGSTEIILKESYLKTLAKGDYVFTAEFKDGTADIKLNVNVSNPSSTSDSGKSPDENNPQTGYKENLLLLIALCSEATVVLALVKKMKSRNAAGGMQI